MPTLQIVQNKIVHNNVLFAICIHENMIKGYLFLSKKIFLSYKEYEIKVSLHMVIAILIAIVSA